MSSIVVLCLLMSEQKKKKKRQIKLSMVVEGYDSRILIFSRMGAR